jgi:hygromycin-B 4-O-kinase
MNKEKTQLTSQEITAFLQKQCAVSATNLQQLVEGEESQAFSYECNAKEYVIRINQRIAGFQKDAYAHSHFQSAKVPIPKVTQLGYIDEHHTFCLTEKMPGITLQDVDSQTLKQLLQPTTDVWLALGDCAISHTTGFGDFDARGQGTYRRWSQFLLSILDPQMHNWNNVLPSEHQKMFEEVVAAFTSLIPYCPEGRSLIHGDFGANNVLTDGQRITAVLDWANAKYGDPLFDVATAFFWSPWLDCMAAQAAYFEPYISRLPHSHERLVCYQLYIGLAEIYDSSLRQKGEMALWALQRSAEIVHNFLTA